MMVAALDPAKLIDTGRYPIADPEAPAFAKTVAAARDSFDRDGLALLPGFLKPEICRAMTAEAEAALPRAHRRDIAFNVYRDETQDRPPEGHPALKASPFCQWVIATDLLPEEGALRGLFQWQPLTRFVGALVGEKLYCTADPLAACNVTVMREGDQHGWHFDSNDFVVSLLLQAPEKGGRFEVRPGARGERGIEHDVVASATRRQRSRGETTAALGRHAVGLPWRAGAASRQPRRGPAPSLHRAVLLRPAARHDVLGRRADGGVRAGGLERWSSQVDAGQVAMTQLIRPSGALRLTARFR